MRVRPRSSAKNAWLLSPPSIVLLFSRPEMPRKLIKPNVPSGTAPGVSSAKLDQRRPLMGSSLIEVWRSEERRVGKECRSRWWADHEKENQKESVGVRELT